MVEKKVEVIQKESKPILEHIKNYLLEKKASIPERYGVGRAIQYFLNEVRQGLLTLKTLP